jgi:hypothetical protein
LPRATGAALAVWLGAAGASVSAASASAASELKGPAVEDRPTVVLDETGCTSVPRSELRRLIGLELGTLLATPAMESAAGEASSNAARLTLSCDATRAVIRVRARRSLERAEDAWTLERTVSLADFPGDAAARGLALASIELLATMETTVRAKIAGSRPTPGRAASVSLAVVGLRRQFLGGAGLGAWGGRFELMRDGERLRLAGDLEVAATGTTSSALGEARALLASVAGFVGARFAPTGNVTLALAAGARVGLARLQGSPAVETGAVGSTVWRPWWGPVLSARATVGGPRLAGLASLELGVTALGAEALAATTTVLAAQGVWWTSAVGVEF